MHTHVTGTPCHGALIDRRRPLIRLALNAQIHDLIPANGTLESERPPRTLSTCISQLHRHTQFH